MIEVPIYKWVILIEEPIKDEVIITATTSGIFLALKATNVKPLKASLDDMDVMKRAGGIYVGVLEKDNAAYKR